MKLLKLTLLFTFYFSISYAQQDTKVNVYLDENFKPIELNNYHKKCNAFLYRCEKTENDSMVVNSMKSLYKFGQLETTENTQIRQLLVSKTREKDIMSKTILISYVEAVNGYKEQGKIPTKEVNINGETMVLEYSPEVYNDQRITFDKTQKKCIKLASKNEIAPLYFYKNNNGYNTTPENFKWYKDSNFLNSLFFKSSSGILILKPNGQYFMYRYLPEQIVETLFRNDWTTFITDYQYAEKHLLERPNGFFNDIQEINKEMNINLITNSNYLGNSYLVDFIKLDLVNSKKLKSYIFNMTTECYTYANY